MKTNRHQPPQIVILCEDKTHYHFARKYLQCRGFKKIRKKMSCEGRGSGEQYVREHYALELKAYRSQMNHLNITTLKVTKIMLYIQGVTIRIIFSNLLIFIDFSC